MGITKKKNTTRSSEFNQKGSTLSGSGVIGSLGFCPLLCSLSVAEGKKIIEIMKPKSIKLTSGAQQQQ